MGEPIEVRLLCATVVESGGLRDNDAAILEIWGGSNIIIYDMEQAGPFVHDILTKPPPSAGLWIWEGTVRIDFDGYPFDPPDAETIYEGEYRRLTLREHFRLWRGRSVFREPKPKAPPLYVEEGRSNTENESNE